MSKKVIKHILICILSFVILYSIATWFFISSSQSISQSNLKELNLIERSPQFIYGKSTSHANALSVKLDELGEAAFLFKAPEFNANKYSKITVNIKNLPINYQVKLVWVKADNTDPIEQRLLQPFGKNATTLLNNLKDWNGSVGQIGLRIIPQEHLGLSNPLDHSIIVEKIMLSQANFISDYWVLANYWLDYKPWTYRSINHSRLNKSLPIYATPLFIIVTWLTICLLFSKLLKLSSVYFLIIPLVAWLFLDMLFLQNNKLISQWTNDVYANGELNHPDETLYQLANQVKSLLNLNKNHSANKKHKVLILCSNRYNRSRLIFHMLPLNSSFLDTINERNSNATLKAGDIVLSYNIAKILVRPKNGVLKFNGDSVNVKEIAKGNDFSIMRVIK